MGGREERRDGPGSRWQLPRPWRACESISLTCPQRGIALLPDYSGVLLEVVAAGREVPRRANASAGAAARNTM